MPAFRPPLRPQSAGSHFWSRYQINVGVSVVRVGSQFRELPGPRADELVGREGTDWFVGGHVYYVTDEIGEALASSGFDVDMDDGYGLGAYGDENYGD